MNPLEEVEQFLYDKIKKINLNNPTGINTGAALVKMDPNWETKLVVFVGIAFATIQQQFSKYTSSSPYGSAKLTNVSMSIGKQIGNSLTRQPLAWHTEVRLGDIFIEAFKRAELIKLEYPKRRDSSYTIETTENWTLIADLPGFRERIAIQGTVDVRPPDIHRLSQKVIDREVSIIKNGDNPIDANAPWVKSINNLQQVGWKVNERVLRIVKTNESMFTSDVEIKDNDAKEQKRRSKRVEWAFITEKAEKLKEMDEIYQYIDADYRGRLYYIEPFLNFQGPDLARGLLLFDRAKPMTEGGLRWLAIHTAASYNMSYEIGEIPEWCEEDYRSHLLKEGLDNISVDKMTLNDRVEWTNQYMTEIVEAGLTENLSQEAEKPVAFLACCLEWGDIHEAAANGKVHESRLPIPIDGSNNGWQHLGAISKDIHTGKLVGLVEVPIQKDFYVQTAKKLLEKCEDEELNSILEQMPMKKIRKGISKRGSMTRAYSAGQLKIAENMFTDCKTEDYHTTYGITEEVCSKLASLLIDSIDEVCPGPLTTMGYLQDLAIYEIGKFERVNADGIESGKEYSALNKQLRQLSKLKDPTDEELEEISKLTNEIKTYKVVKAYGNGSDLLTWTTPSEFNVEYKNYRTQDGKIKGTIDSQRITHVIKIPSSYPDIRGFMCGVSPNFIHSMDASHMSIVIAEWYGDFGAVHDSFSTHACDVDNLLFKAQEVFIRMYDVENFYDYIENQIVTDNTKLDVKQPALGELNIGDIYDSEYFFA